MSSFSNFSGKNQKQIVPVRFVLIVVMNLSLLFISACEDVEQKLSRISKHGGTSHNGGQNCVQTGCHDSNSNIEFSYAGTVYEFDSVSGTPNVPIPNSDIHFVSDTLNPSTSIDKTIQVDASGNFYTTENITLNYPTQVPCMVPSGTSNYYCMPHTVSNVAGNSCSASACHLNRRINSDVTYECPAGAFC